MGSDRQSSLTLAGAFLLLSFFLSQSLASFFLFYAKYFLVPVVLVVLCCLCFKKCVVFLVCFNAHQHTTPITRKNHSIHQQHKLSTNKQTKKKTSTPLTTSFQLLKKIKDKSNACLIISQHCFKISHFPCFRFHWLPMFFLCFWCQCWPRSSYLHISVSGLKNALLEVPQRSVIQVLPIFLLVVILWLRDETR